MHLQNLAHQWFNHHIFMSKRQSPNGEGFRLKLHEEHPYAPLSPFYLDFRRLQSNPQLLKDTALQLSEHMEKDDSEHDLIAGIPIAATPLATALSLHTNIPMVTPREGKTHGSGALVDGVYEEGMRVALIDDLITSAASKFEAIHTLKNAGLKVDGVYVLVDRMQGGMEELRKAGYHASAS
jgi:uridine monophosphate synthetase